MKIKKSKQITQQLSKNKKFWIISAAVAVATGIWLIISTMFGEPLTSSEAAGIFVWLAKLSEFVFPAIAAAVGAFFISKKSTNQQDSIFYPTLGTTAIGILISAYLIFSFFATTAEEWQVGALDFQYSTGVEYTANQFMFISGMTILPEIIKILLSYFALGVIGSILGRKFAQKFPK